MTKLVRDWDQVYDVYASHDWLRALDAWRHSADEYPEDVASRYLSRPHRRIHARAAAEKWDGIIRFIENRTRILADGWRLKGSTPIESQFEQLEAS